MADKSAVVSVDEVEKPKTTWKSHIWDTFDYGPQERKLVFKIDLTLLAFACFSSFFKYLDRANLQNAFVSGMKEDLNLYGNQLNYANTAFDAACLVVAIPASLLMARISTKWFTCGIEIGWIICTFGLAGIQNSRDMIAIRFLTGFFEAGHYPALMYLMGSWYTKREIGKRIACVQVTNAVGSMISGYLQSAAYTGLNGVHNMAGWRWLFIIDGIFSVGLIIPMLFVYPDVVSSQNANWIFSEEEILLARKRNESEGHVPRAKIDFKRIVPSLMRLDVWLFFVLSFCQNANSTPSSSMSFWLKGWNSIKPGTFSVPQINNLPTVMKVVQLVIAIVGGWTSDTILKGRRWPGTALGGFVVAINSMLLAVTPVYSEHKALRFWLYYNTEWTLGLSGLYWNWVQDVYSGDLVLRSFVSQGIEMFAYIEDIFLPNILFQTKHQPVVTGGNWSAFGFGLGQLFIALFLAYYLNKKSKTESISEDESESSP